MEFLHLLLVGLLILLWLHGAVLTFNASPIAGFLLLILTGGAPFFVVGGVYWVSALFGKKFNLASFVLKGADSE